MVLVSTTILWLFLMHPAEVFGLSFNQPKFCGNATWDPDGITFLNNTASPFGILVDRNDTVYVNEQGNNRVTIWSQNTTNPIRTLSGNLNSPGVTFIANNGDIYVDNGNNGAIVVWKANGTIITLQLNLSTHCLGLFIDKNNSLYCSLDGAHIVVKTLLNDPVYTLITVAGNGTGGSAANLLKNPNDIFVDENFTLYVADCFNSRIQRFNLGQTNATTVAGNGASNTISLSLPTGVVLDADGYLWIADAFNNRIVGSGPYGFRCIVGCNGSSGSTPTTLSQPRTFSFDSFGNIYVADTGNNRIQKFTLMAISCETKLIVTYKLIRRQQQQPQQRRQQRQQQRRQQQKQQQQQHQQRQQQRRRRRRQQQQHQSTFKASCNPPVVTLVPNQSTLIRPLEFRRSQDISIVSIIQFNCNSSLSITTQWIIKNCTNNCSYRVQLGSTIPTTFSELNIPARILPYGTYELQLNVTMTKYPLLMTSSAVYVKIVPSNIIPNLFQFGTPMITSGHAQDLRLDPGTYSVDPEENTFNSSNWIYKYYCRIYDFYQFPTVNGTLITIDDQRNDTSNPSCLSNRTAWKFDNPLNSSLTILSGSLQSNRTYQFMVQMENRRNSWQQVIGYVLVQVEGSQRPFIAIGCVISTMCTYNSEYQLVNPTTQVALFSLCNGNCTSIQNITWRIYSGAKNSSSNNTIWSLLNQLNFYDNSWFFGRKTSNFTVTNLLFLNYPLITYWQFEVTYSFSSSETSVSALNFVINQPPVNGSCSISPQNGTTSTSFTISCPNWFDQDGIKDYSFYTWTTDRSQKMMIAFSSISQLQVQLPTGNDQTGTLYLMVSIRDQLSGVTEYNISSVKVLPDLTAINNLITSLQTTSTEILNNPFVQLLASENPNTVGQVITSLSQQFNKMNAESVNQAAVNGIPTASIAISSLDTAPSLTIGQFNQSAFIEFQKELNSQANVREYLMPFATNLPITTSNSIKLQSSSLAQLTKATNLLTRTTLALASNRCYQLTLVLLSMSTTISYEDVETAATQLIQCGSNVLNAVNGPLQERTIVLESDATGASTFPQDYDTDLESEGSKINLMDDKNSYYQKQLANQIQNQMNEIIVKLTSALNIHLNTGQQSIMNTSQVFMSLAIQSFQSLSNDYIQQMGDASIRLPSIFQTNSSANSIVSIRSMMQPLAPYGNSEWSSNTNASRSVSLSIVDQNENDIPIQANDSHPIEIIIPRDPNLIIPSIILQNVTSTNSTSHNQLFNLHYVNITSILSISVHFEVSPLNNSLAYLLIYKFDQIPLLNRSIHQIDGWTILCPSNLSNDGIYHYFIDNQHTQNHQSLVVGLRELDSNESIVYCSNSSITNPPITNRRFHFTSNYGLRTYSSGCYYLDKNNQWKDDGLRVGSSTNYSQIQCFSTHLTTFAGGFIVLPEPVNWQYIFANANFAKNKTIYLTVICVTIMYLLLLIYARYNDKKDVEKLGVTSLPENHPTDKYYYQILVFTGHRKDAGTKSNVYLIISGDKETTKVRRLIDLDRSILQRGGIDAFILAVPKSLGLLHCIRIWHDNSGKGESASWFLKYIIVRDLQTMEKFHFLAQRWFAVEKDDGKIERVLPVASEIEKNTFSYLLTKQAYRSASDGHLWFSIFSRPPSNQFTRVQRCTCCLVLLFLSMFLNIMYYDLSTQAKTNNSTDSLRIGPFVIGREQIAIGVIVEILALIPSLLLVQIFRRLRPRRKSISRIRQSLHQLNPSIQIKEQIEIKQKKTLTFPWWFLFIGYGLCLILVGVSILFSIARGIEFGDVKTQQWLTSIFTGFFSSICLSQPLKILSLTVFFTFFCRKSDDDKEVNEYLSDEQIEFDEDEEYFQRKHRRLFTHRSSIEIVPLDQIELAYARQQRLKEIQMWSILHDTFIYLTYLSLLFVIIYSNQSQHSFLQVQHLQKYLRNSRQTNLDFDQILTINQYWNWLEESFVTNIRAQQWYNEDPPRNLSGFMNDKSNRLIGWPTMRQLRIKSELCSKKQNIIRTCQFDYDQSNEEKHSFSLGWENQTTVIANSSIDRAFQYQSADELDSYSYKGDYANYEGGGYVYEFRGRLSDLQSNLSTLHQFEWINSQTRAIFIELSLYNPNVQLLTSVTLLAEFLPNGDVHTQSRFEPIDFYQSVISITQLICTIVYMLLIIYFMFMEIQSLFRLKWKYVYEFWSWIELGIISCSWLAIAIYIRRCQECSRIGELFEQTNGYVYINLQFLTYLNNYLTCIYGLCCFCGTLKMIRLCRFHSRVYLFIHTLKRAAKELISFTLMFSIVFIAFICLFYLLFQSRLYSASSFVKTAEMLFEMAIMKFNTYELSDAAAFLGPFCFSLFVLLVVFICLSMFISIIIDNFRQSRDTMKKDEGIYTFMFDRFVRWTGLKKPTATELWEKHDSLMRTQYLDRMDLFAKRIDELLDTLTRIHES